MIRQLQVGELPPACEPRRYRNQAGYIRLRWRVGPKEYVEVYEHRFIAGLSAPEVHHVNRIKDDNDPKNLQPLSTIAHGAEHSRIDVDEAVQLYAEGWSLPRLAQRYGVSNPTVLRCFQRRGVQTRTLSESWQFRGPYPRRGASHHNAKLNDLAAETIRNAVADGTSTRILAQRYGVSVSCIQRAAAGTTYADPAVVQRLRTEKT